MSAHNGALRQDPLDSRWLDTWIQPQHLAADALESYRRVIDRHPARLLVIGNWLVDRVAEQVGQCLRAETDSRIVYGLRSRPHGDEIGEGDWVNAPEADRVYRYAVSSGVRPEYRFSPNVLALLKLRRALHDARFVRFVEEATGLLLGASTFDAHIMRAGDFLAAHSDAKDRRRLACVVFLSSDWGPECGGALHLTTSDGRDWAIDATFNTVVIFDVTAKTQHFVDPVATGAAARVTMGGWILERI